MSCHVINNSVKIAQLETQGEGRTFPMDTHDSFEVSPETRKNGQSHLKRRLYMISELIDDALELVMDLLIEQSKLVRVLQVLLDELKQLVAHLAIDKKRKQVGA